MSEMEFKTVGDALPELHRKGYDKTFLPVGKKLRCQETGKLYPPNEALIAQIYRFEGESDPAEMSVVYALEMTDGAKGTIIDAFGAYSRADLGDVLKLLPAIEPSRRTL